MLMRMRAGRTLTALQMEDATRFYAVASLPTWSVFHQLLFILQTTSLLFAVVSPPPPHLYMAVLGSLTWSKPGSLVGNDPLGMHSGK